MAKVLVVDDSLTMRQQVKQVLSGAGHTILEAVDGQDGFDKIAADSSIQVVILDVNMPRMNGIELVEKLKSSGKMAGLSVMMLTTEGHADLIRRAKGAGAKGWIVKPFKPDMLLAAVKKMAA